jgi:hypothetical protein
MKKNKKENGFVLVFVIAVVAALSLMTASMNFYYDSALKSVTRNSVFQQMKLASETGAQAAQTWILERLNRNQFSLLDMQNNFHVDNSNNQCLNRHGYTDSTKDVFFSKRIIGNLGSDDPKFENVQYEVFIQRHADVIKSIYFTGSGGSSTSLNRSAAYVRKFKDFPNTQFTVEMWLKNMHDDSDTYNMHAWEWGRTWDAVFKVWRKNPSDEHSFSPRIGNVVLSTSGGQNPGESVRKEWTHIAWVWDGGNSLGNVRVYQNGILTGTWTASVPPAYSTSYGVTNNAQQLADSDDYPLAIGEGTNGFSGSNVLASAQNNAVKFQGTSWKGNFSEIRFWNISRTQANIADNFRTRLTGSEPGLVSYYKFNEGAGTAAIDYNVSRPASRKNDLTILGFGLSEPTLWKEEKVFYPLVANHNSTPLINVPPGEDIAYYKILSCGKGPGGQLVPLQTIVSAPVVQGNVGEGEISITTEDIIFIDSGHSPSSVELSFFSNGSSNSIYMQGEDSLDHKSLPAGWTTAQPFTNNTTPLVLTPPANVTLLEIKNALASVFYNSCSTNHDCSVKPSLYTPGKRRIKAKLIFSNTALNQEIGIVKNLPARNKVLLSPVSWNIR